LHIPYRTKDFSYEPLDIVSHPCPPNDLLQLINPAYAKNYKIVPLKYKNNILTIAMAEPNSAVLDEVISIYKKSFPQIYDVKIVIASTKRSSIQLISST